MQKTKKSIILAKVVALFDDLQINTIVIGIPIAQRVTIRQAIVDLRFRHIELSLLRRQN